MYYGASYYPEQYKPSDIDTDINLMKQAGFNLVRMGEFAWSKFEPREGEYDFSWFDGVIEKLGRSGILSIVCTPTANPPVWLVEKHPEILYTDNRGVVRPFGGRRHYCYNSAMYREYCRRIAGAIAGRYGKNEHVLGFQIDNELAWEQTARCHCGECKRKFHAWLEKKYGSIDALNEKMGTIFWGQTYERFDQINMPIRTIETNTEQLLDYYYENPSLRLDYERYCSQSIMEFQNVQAEEIRKHTSKTVTTNCIGPSNNGMNYHESYASLDVASPDIYPSLRTNESYHTSFDFAFARGIKGKNFWMVETSSGGGHGVWGKQGILQPFPGCLRQNAIHAFAGGADVMCYFQWKTFRFGAEQLEAAIMDNDNIPRRRFAEFKAASADLRKVKDILNNTKIINETAICFDYDSFWASCIKPFHSEFYYSHFCAELYGSLAKAGIGADVIPCTDAINRYRLIILPAMMIMGDDFKETLRKYVESGGVVLMTFLSSIKDVYNNAPAAQSFPAGLTDLFGIRVGEGEPVFGSTIAEISFTLDGRDHAGTNRYWTESIEPLDAQVIGRYSSTYRSGEALISRKAVGAGQAYYLGCGLDEDSCQELLRSIAAENGISRVPVSFEDGVEVIRRSGGGRTVYFVLNARESIAEITLDRNYMDLLNGGVRTGTVKMKPKEYVVLEET